ncbi:hypothetical protein BLN97_02825 [Bradyrhizobium elkanii]|nr:hypothetical protein BLN97_02825 [Bradyrhizobium elkanii]
MKVPFHGEAQRASDFHDFGEMDPAELRVSERKITQTEKSVWLIGIGLADEPSRARIGCEELDDGKRIPFVSQGVDQKPNPVFDREQIDVSHGG